MADTKQHVTLGVGTHVFWDNLMDPDTIYHGAGPGTVIRALDPDLEWVRLGPRSAVLNAAIHDRFGTNPEVMRGGPNGPRPFTYIENATDSTVISRHWFEMPILINGGKPGVDAPVVGVRVVGQWNGAVYAEAYEKSYCFHAWAFNQSKGMLVQHFDAASGVFIIAEPNSNPPFGSLTLRPAADVRSIHIQPTVAVTKADIQMVSEQRTQGPFIDVYHKSSDYAGPIIHANMADEGGSFTGRIIDVSNEGRPVFHVDSEGDVTAGKLAQRVAELEQKLAELEFKLNSLL